MWTRVLSARTIRCCVTPPSLHYLGAAGSTRPRHTEQRGPVAQWIERQPSKLRAEVRLLPGPLSVRAIFGTRMNTRERRAKDQRICKAAQGHSDSRAGYGNRMNRRVRRTKTPGFTKW